ncbi:MAG: NAD-dependent epimerase/dehydratase family protein, partial [Chloroflexota bacterium]|nr:NAD-dependent epimerase/dehydratase family protein [Chloroflexota bacterium]
AVWNGLHERVLADPALAAAAKRGGATVRELREPPAYLPIGGHRKRREGAIVVLTVGTDAAVGKMTASLEIVEALRRVGKRAAFVATGQTGIAIAGEGISVDAVVADFIAGAAEQMVCDAAEEADYVIVEGQGSLAHPGFSGVTMGLLHGTSPDLMVLCHDFVRTVMKGYEQEGLRVRSLEENIAIYEEAASWRHEPGRPRAKVVAIALNTSGLTGALAAAAVAEASGRTKLPSADPILLRGVGGDLLAWAILEAAAQRRQVTS